MNVQSLISFAGLFICSACTADLAVYDDKGEKLPGYPVNKPVTILIHGEYTTHSKLGDKCVRSPMPTKFLSLPVGDQIYVEPETGPLANSEFGLGFADAGGVKSLTLNSESNLPASLDSVTDLFSKVAPYALGAPAGAQSVLEAGDTAACDAGEEIQFIETLDEALRRLRGRS